MMTHKTSRTRILIKQLTIVPILIVAALLFGSYAAGQESKTEDLELIAQKGDLNAIVQTFSEVARQYMQMPVNTTSKDDLQKVYDKVMEWYNAIDVEQKIVYQEKATEAPPLPPLPRNPEWRLENKRK